MPPASASTYAPPMSANAQPPSAAQQHSLTGGETAPALASAPQRSLPQPEREEPASARGPRRFCMNCGAQHPENARFCMECGTKVGQA